MVFNQDILQFFLNLLKLHFKFVCLIIVSDFLSVFIHKHASTLSSFLAVAALFSSSSAWGSSSACGLGLAAGGQRVRLLVVGRSLPVVFATDFP